MGMLSELLLALVEARRLAQGLRSAAEVYYWAEQ